MVAIHIFCYLYRRPQLLNVLEILVLLSSVITPDAQVTSSWSQWRVASFPLLRVQRALCSYKVYDSGSIYVYISDDHTIARSSPSLSLCAPLSPLF